MNLLYLTEDYLHSKVHNNLLTHILEQDDNLKIFVFIPTRPRMGETLVSSYHHHDRLIEVTVPIDISQRLYRLNFFAKIRCKVRLIEKSIPIKEIDVIHAATLYTEGATARALQKKYGIPYFVSMRGTDCGLYSRKMIHLWPLANSVLKRAGFLAYVTPTIKQKMMEKWQYRLMQKKLCEGEIINNGIDSIWTDNIHISPKTIGDPVRVIYIGRFDKNKNVMRLIEAIKEVRQYKNIRLTLIGGDGEQQAEVESEVSLHSNYIEYLGKIYDKQNLMQIVRQCDIFTMVSHGETFGLVYAECLSQGLPLIYTLGTGFDNMYPQGVIGYGVNSHSVENIKEGIEYVINNYQTIRENISKIKFDRYSWTKIAQNYLKIYKSISHVL